MPIEQYLAKDLLPGTSAFITGGGLTLSGSCIVNQAVRSHLPV